MVEAIKAINIENMNVGRSELTPELMGGGWRQPNPSLYMLWARIKMFWCGEAVGTSPAKGPPPRDIC